MFLDRVPEGIAPGEVENALADLSWVERVHDLHIWPMSTTEIALTCHIVMPEGHPGDQFLHDAASKLGRDFKIGHVTIQVETNADLACKLAPNEVV